MLGVRSPRVRASQRLAVAIRKRLRRVPAPAPAELQRGGRRRQALSRTGRRPNTLILFASDNGMLFGENRWNNKIVPYDESLRIPLIARWDAAGTAGTTSSAFVSNVDFAETIMDAAGVPFPAGSTTDGQSLLPVVTGSGPIARENVLIGHAGGAAVPVYCGVRVSGWMFVRGCVRRGGALRPHGRPLGDAEPGLRCRARRPPRPPAIHGATAVPAHAARLRVVSIERAAIGGRGDGSVTSAACAAANDGRRQNAMTLRIASPRRMDSTASLIASSG